LMHGEITANNCSRSHRNQDIYPVVNAERSSVARLERNESSCAPVDF
jgi:hypothetical protein